MMVAFQCARLSIRGCKAMARKALVDGLVRYDETRGGWRGAQEQIDLAAGEWGEQLAGIEALDDVDPWRLAVVLEIADDEARIGLQPERRGRWRYRAKNVRRA